MKQIVFIDDDLASIKDTYMEACKLAFRNCEILHFKYPQEAQKHLEKNSKKVSVIILDIMFAGDGEYAGGFDEGAVFFREQLLINYNKIPVIILTHTPDAKTTLGIEGCDHVYQKTDRNLTLKKFVALVKKLSKT